MSLETEVRRYFGQAGFARFLTELRRQYQSSKNGARGYVALSDVSEDEREALDAFYETYSPPPAAGETRRYSIKKFAALLQQSRFGLTVPELLAMLAGESVLTLGERQQLIDAEWNRMIEGELAAALLDADGDDRAIAWAEGLAAERSPGSRTLRLIFAKSPLDAQPALRHALAGLHMLLASALTMRPIRLPILSALATGDSHALDWKRPGGRLFWWGLASISGLVPTSMTEEETGGEADGTPTDAGVTQAMLLRDVYRACGVSDDDLSSQAMLYAPELYGPEERILTLRQVERLDADRLRRLRAPAIHMVENPAVFAVLADADAARADRTEKDAIAPVIICGNGQPTLAVVGLLERLISALPDIALYYSGDLDYAGLMIAQSLQKRFGSRFRAWRMSLDVYRRHAHVGVPIQEAERLRLQRSVFEWDPALGREIAEKGVKLHQELWTDELLADLTGRGRDHEA
ncbi:TIGR02679 domain-containing protein [Cohnella sp. GbtcB17]|uniref:TIGR02679 domain-containing protein n=1 Tax=Cohnella sp. GbtcB17 TaxID=2824762 RepID=UPI001C2F8D76|nr:TIGR02679 domain-containing protein [Cohnella sp. GbtcB17]